VNYGNDPSSYRWYSVRTPHYRLIYPQGTDSLARHYAELLERALPYEKEGIGGRKDWHYPVVLHPGNMQSNGLVSWAPRRMELLTTPSTSIFAQSWREQLILHESRHVVQMNKLNNGIFRPLYYLIGEHTAGLAGLFVPTWFFEGDAVAAETALSVGSGRGRLPEFSMSYRAREVTGERFRYDKWYLGSYKHEVGDKYAFGYNLTAYARKRFGADIWDTVLDRYTRRIFNIPPFSKALEHATHLHTTDLFKETFDFLNQEWQQQEAAYVQSGFRPAYLTRPTTDYTAYQYPYALPDGSVLAVKSGYDDLNALVRIQPNGEEIHLIYIGTLNGRITVSGGKVYWSEIVPSLRWEHLNYSVIKSYDLTTGKRETLTEKTRYLSPAVNSREDMAVSYPTETGTNYVLLLSGGQEKRRFVIPENGFAKELEWIGNSELAATVLTDDGLSIWRLDTQTGRWTTLLADTRANINHLRALGDTLFFESGLNGTNNIYALNVQTQQVERLTTARFGAFMPAPSADGKLVFADYGINGYHLSVVRRDTLRTYPADFTKPYEPALAQAISRPLESRVDTTETREFTFTPKPYHKLAHLLNVHSWLPFYFDIDDALTIGSDGFSLPLKPGVMLLSQNALNTAITQAAWYIDDGYNHGKLNFTYTGIYPVLQLEADYGGQAFDVRWNQTSIGEPIRAIRSFPGRTRLELSATTYLPLNFTRSYYVHTLRPSVSYYYTNNRYEHYEEPGEMKDFTYLFSSVTYSYYRRMAKRDIIPRWGFQAQIFHLATIGDASNYGSLYGGRLTGYLPGLRRNDGLMLRAAYQQQTVGDYGGIPKQILSSARGYAYDYTARRMYTLRADYNFTWAMPDWSLGRLMYVRRMRSNVFYDLYNTLGRNDVYHTRQSCGVDFLLDCNLIQTEFPVSMGVRTILPFSNKKPTLGFEFLFSASF
jgi:hypothetical protein